jgi:hypothetical protein
MALRGFIGSTELHLPEDFSLPREALSPIYDLQQFVVTEFSMNILFPLTPQNRLAFNFADELAVSEKQLKYPDFRLEEDGEIRTYGTLEFVKVRHRDGEGVIDTNFYSNLLPYNPDEKQLSEVVTKIVSLGSSTAAIMAAVGSANLASLSSDGITGSFLRFYPTKAEDFYGDTNPDWWPDVKKYNPESNYATDDVVKFRLPEFINDYDVPTETQHAIVERYFQVIHDAEPAVEDGETPFSHSEKFKIITPGIFNLPDGENNGNSLRANESYDPTLKAINRFGLLPYIQLHDIIREVGKSLGYTVKGEYMDDSNERKVTFQSNLALDKNSGGPNHIYVGLEEPKLLGPGIVLGVPAQFTLEDGIYFDPSNLWNLSEPSYIPPITDDYFLVKIKVRIKNNHAETRFLEIRLVELDPLTDIANPQYDIPGGQLKNIEYTAVHAFTAANEVSVRWSTPDDVDFEILHATLEIRNLNTDLINVFEGDVRYADHMPDMTVSKFMQAVKLWKNLFPIWDPKSKILYLDYTDNRLRDNAGLVEMKQFAETSDEQTLKAKKRFRMNYGVLPEIFEPLNGFTELDPVNSATDLPAPNVPNRFIKVRNENAYYFTKEYDYGGGRLFWQFGGYDWTDLQVEEEGDEMAIIPDLGPVPMERFHGTEGEFLAPVYHGSGRSAMYYPGGSRPPLRLIYDMAFLNPYSAFYRFGNTVNRTQGGDVLGDDVMTWQAILNGKWKRTLQMLVLEEITRNAYRFPPEKQQLINFARIFLLGHVPVIPIKLTEAIGGNGLLEIEARKVKNVAVKVIGAVAEDEPVGPELWTPEELVPVVWLDFADETKVVLDDSNKIETILDKSIYSGAFSQSDPTKRPSYSLHPVTGKMSYRNSDASLKYLDFLIELENERHTIYTVHRIENDSWCGIIFSRSPALWGLHPRPSITRYWTYPGPTLFHYYNGIYLSTGGLNLDGFFSFETQGNTAASLYSGSIGRDPSYTNRNLQGWIGEIVVCSGTHDEETRQKVEGYLAWKHGLHANLPVGHPYLSGAPTI